MDIEAILAIVLIFGGAAATALAFSPIGRAIADRIRRRGGGPEPDPLVHEELARLRDDLAEVHERLEFAERLLAQRDATRLPADPSGRSVR